MHRRFSLIEIIIITAIFSILLTLLTPAISKINNTANLSKCQIHEKTIYSGVIFFVDDHNNMFPGPVGPDVGPTYIYRTSRKLGIKNKKRHYLSYYLKDYFPYQILETDDGLLQDRLKFYSNFTCPSTLDFLSEKGDENLGLYDEHHYNLLRVNDYYPLGKPPTYWKGYRKPEKSPQSFNEINEPGTSKMLKDRRFTIAKQTEVTPHSFYLENIIFFDGHVESSEAKLD